MTVAGYYCPVRIIILSGLSGSGKSVALHMLEDLGFYCIDNIPAALLKPFISYTVRSAETTYERTAIGLDARNTPAEIASVPQLIDELRRSGMQCEVLFLVAAEDELLRRFAETRRKHPMSGGEVGLREAMALERALLEPIASVADLLIDTSRLAVHALRDIIHKRVEQRGAGRLSLTFESFGFKRGIPADADFVFDARALPNPYWEPGLRNLTGRDRRGDALSRDTHQRGDADRRTSRASCAGACRNTRRATAVTSRSRSAAPAGSIARCTSSIGWRRFSPPSSATSPRVTAACPGAKLFHPRGRAAEPAAVG